MKNINTLLHFMRYFEPHCLILNDTRICYVSALEYPDRQDVVDLFSGSGFLREEPRNVVMKYAGIVRDGDEDHWMLVETQQPGFYPVWEIQ